MNLFAYPTYQAFADMMLPIRHGAALVNHSLDAWPAFGDTSHGRSIRAACELLTLAGLTPVRPPFGIDSVVTEGKPVRIIEEVAAHTPFCSLLHFRKDTTLSHPQPRVLVTSPVHLRALMMSGQALPPVSLMVSATAPLAADLARTAEARLDAPLLEIYGSTESGQIATRRTAQRADWRLPGCLKEIPHSYRRRSLWQTRRKRRLRRRWENS